MAVKKPWEEELEKEQQQAERRWDENIDYGTLIKEQIAAGADRQQVADTLGTRVEKAASTPGLERYAYDDIYRQAIDYISGGEAQQPDYTSPEWTSKYTKQIDELTGNILGRGGFTYDVNTDPMYDQYAEIYERGGRRAMEDVLGQMSARTGGLASTYAQSAAQQEYNNYMASLADKVPELRSLAYEMYMDEADRQRADLDMLMGLDQLDYSRYQSQLEREKDERDEARDRLENYLDIGGSIDAFDEALLGQTGYTDSEIDAIRGLYAPETPKYTYTGGSGGGGSDDDEEEKPKTKTTNRQSLFPALTGTGSRAVGAKLEENKQADAQADQIAALLESGAITVEEAERRAKALGLV